MDSVDNTIGSSILGLQACWDFLHTGSVGRVGFLDTDGVVILPVNYAVVDQTVIIRTNPMGPIAAVAAGGAPVTFEVDDHNGVGNAGWSVLLRGTLERLPAAEVDLLVHSGRRLPWAGEGRPLSLRLAPRSVEGRRVRHTEP